MQMPVKMMHVLSYELISACSVIRSMKKKALLKSRPVQAIRNVNSVYLTT